jgi:hypothetical protein
MVNRENDNLTPLLIEGGDGRQAAERSAAGRRGSQACAIAQAERLA